MAANPALTWATAFVVSGAEALVVIGALVPGTPLLMALGAAASLGHASIYGIVVAAILGAIAGDGISFWIGRRHSGRLLAGWPFATRPGLLAKGKAFIGRFGIAGVALAQFLPGVRAIVPVVAGMFGMRPSAFYAANAASAMVWAPIHVLPCALVGLLARSHLTANLEALAVPFAAALGLLAWALRRAGSLKGDP